MSTILDEIPWRRRVLAVVALLAVAGSFFGALGSAPLFDVDEGAFSQATMEMFQRGDFVSPHLNGALRFDKPILIYWLQAASVTLFGPTETAFRLPSALSAALWVLAVFVFVRRHVGTDTALLAAIIMATTPGVLVIGRAATADALLNMLIAVSMLCAWQYQACGARAWLVAAHAAAGAGMLAKGPVAVFVPAVTTLLFCVLRRDLRTWVRGAFDWRGLAVFTAIAAPWYVAILSREGWPFVQGFFLKHHLDRLSGPLEGHAGSLIYYAPVLLLIVMPFTGLLWPVARRWRDVWRDDLQAYLLLWFAVVFVFFSLSGTKLPHYLLYGITGLVVLMARHAEAPAARMALLGPAVVWAGALFALPWIVGLAQPHVPDPHYRHVLSDVRPYFSPAGLAFSGGAFALITLLAAARWLRPGDVLVTCASASVCTILVVILPIVAAVAQGPVKEAALICRARGIVPVVWRLNAPSVSVYRGAATPRRNPMPGDVVLTRSVALKDLPGAAGTVLYEKHGIVLVTVVP